jgi:hypothetical protein
LISGPGFFLDLGKARLLVNSSPQPGGPFVIERPDELRVLVVALADRLAASARGG